MAGTHGQLTSQPLHGGDYASFNWIFLIEYVLCGILCLWFLFYFNRIFAALISYAVRLFTWHQFGVYIDVEALQVSLLAGRIFFKGIRYHGDNETIFVHGGYITWRYWLRKVKKCALFDRRSRHKGYSNVSQDRHVDNEASSNVNEGEDVRAGHNDDLPCRIEVRVSGVEAFIYNRSPAYDWILEGCSNHGSSNSKTAAEAKFTSHSEKTGYQDLDRRKQEHGRSPSLTSSSSDINSASPRPATVEELGSTTQTTQPHKTPSPPSILRLLPVFVHCNKAAAVLGNESTPAILTAKIDSANGTFDASESGPLDIFKILMQFQVNRPFIQMKPNVDYKRPQLAEAALLDPSVKDAKDESSQFSDKAEGHKRTDSERKSAKSRGRFPGLSRKALQSLESVARFPHLSMGTDHLPSAQANPPAQGRWLGLTRYLDDEQRKDEDEWKDLEYAKASTVADITSIDFKFYWDIAGPKPKLDNHAGGGFQTATSSFDVNGSTPPEYGMELLVHGGQVFYGPWADRHRVFLQQLFFPAPFADAKPLKRLSSGDTRLCTVFKLFLSIEADTILRIPFREPSKDYKWKGRSETMNQRRKNNANNDRRRPGWRRNTNTTPHSTHARPYAWFDIRIKPNTTINYSQDMFPSLAGYSNNLRVDVSGIDIHSSLNHALLWRSGNITLTGDLSYPLKWNGLREWTFAIGIFDLDFYLLRDHTFLLMDLIEDWTAGPFPEFLTFVPYRYILKPTFERFKLFLNVNDANIVDRSDDLDDNDFVILYGRDLISELVIPVDRLRPPTNEIAFDVVAHDLGFRLSMPPKNTLAVLLADKDVAQLPEVDLKGTYVLCNEVRSGLVEQLNMEIIGRGLRIAFYGFFARHLAKIKENYFGEDIHFRTLQEYQELARNNFVSKEPQAPIRGNDLDVILDITAEDAHIMVPAGLYSCKEFVELYVDTANVDLRVNNYYLELMVDSSPLQFLHCARSLMAGETSYHLSEPQITIDSVNVYGHRLFGLQPTEPAYVSNWDIDAGDILGDCSPEFLAKVASAAQALALTITDEENGLPIPEATPLYDTTFVRWRSNIIRLWLNVAHEAILFNTQAISGSFNDFATNYASQNLVLHAPEAILACVGSALDSKKPPLESSKETLAYVKTAVSVRMAQRAAGFARLKDGQQVHIDRHDARTKRAAFLLRNAKPSSKSSLVSMCLPPLPGPLQLSSTNLPSHIPLDPAHSQSQGNIPGGHVASTRSYSSLSKLHSSLLAKVYRDESIFFRPDLPSDDSVVDLSNVPQFPSLTDVVDPGSADLAQKSQDNVFNLNSDDDTVHTSVSIHTRPGIIGMCKPRAVIAAASVLETISPREPYAIFDQYQIETAAEVLLVLKKQRGKRFVLDLGICVPYLHTRFINNRAQQDGSAGPIVDVYDIVSNRIALAVRIKSEPERKHADDLKAVHLTMSSISLSAQQLDETETWNESAFRVGINNILLWLADSDRTIVNASYDKLETIVLSKELDYLTGLIYRAVTLGGSLAQPFLNIQAQNARRRRFVVSNLARNSDGIPDPSFLTWPAYMIRSAQDHLRNNDSWKVVARLRWILCCLGPQEHDALWRNCVNDNVDTPSDDEEFVLSVLDQWRSWDAVHVKDSLAMQILFGRRTATKKVNDPGSIPLSVGIRGAGSKAVIDHGTSQNSASIEGITIAVSVSPPPPPSAMQLFREVQEVRSTVIHIGTSKAKISLNWELCNLVDRTMSLFNDSDLKHLLTSESSNSAGSATSSVDMSRKSDVANEAFHIVVQIDDAEADLRTIHLQQTFTSQDLKVSVAGSGWNTSSTDFVLSIVASADVASMSTCRDGKTLLEARLVESSVALFYEEPKSQQGGRNKLHIAGNTLSITVDSKEEIAYYLETADLLLRNEVKRMNEMVLKHVPVSEEVGTASPRDTLSQPIDIHLTLALTSYTFKVATLQDLYYVGEGRVLRVGIRPETSSDQSHRLDFDLKAQKHTLKRGEPQKPLATSVLEMPPINGTVRVLFTSKLTTLSSAITIEQVNLEGSALYGIYSMLSTSGIVQASHSLLEDIQSLQETAHVVLGQTSNSKSKAVNSTAAASDFVFDVALCLVGFSILARSQRKKITQEVSELSFTLGSTHLRAANRSSYSDMPLPFPELRLSLGSMQTQVARESNGKIIPSANVVFGISFNGTVRQIEGNRYARNFSLLASGPTIDIDEHTSPTIVNILAHFQDRMKGLDLSKERQYLRRLRHKQNPFFRQSSDQRQDLQSKEDLPRPTFVNNLSFALEGASIVYIVARETSAAAPRDLQNLSFSLKRIELSTKEEKEATLRIDEVKLQILPHGSSWTQRFVNSALLPEMLFTIHYDTTEKRKLLFRAAGKALDIQCHPDIVRPASALEKSLSKSANNTRVAISRLRKELVSSEISAPKLSSESQTLSSLVIDTSFAGAVIRLLEHDPNEPKSGNFASLSSNTASGLGRYSNLSTDSAVKDAALRAPGIAIRIQYADLNDDDPCLNAEVRINESNNVLTPAVVPLILRIAHNVKNIVHHEGAKDTNKSQLKIPKPQPAVAATATTDEESIIQRNPRALLGRTRLNVGMRISKQQFALICQPVAKVEARMSLGDTYFTINTVDSEETGNFFALSAAFTDMQASLQHVYSRDPTFKFAIESIIISAMNSKHISGDTGISAILKINPMKANLNAKQLQDILLFREIWLPPEIRDSSLRHASQSFEEQQEYFVARYRQIAAATAFPWNATVAIAHLGIELDLGQAIGKLSSDVTNLWASSKKTTTAQQTLSIGVDKISIDASGRMSGFVQLNRVKIRTSIAWPSSATRANQIPLIQGSVGFKELRLKAAFDYQIFAIAHITSFEFIMYNVRDQSQRTGDRLVAILDGERVHVYCVASTAALAVSLAQAFERLFQERKASYEQSLKDIDAFLRRKSSLTRSGTASQAVAPSRGTAAKPANETRLPISLQTDVVVTLGAIDVGAFPRTVMDNQILRLETSEVQARFAVASEGAKIHTGLGLTLGQVRAALAGVPNAGIPKALADIQIDEVVGNATSARGGVILRVPKVVATMQTWQAQYSRTIDYKFRSTFEGKIDVGWNYSRISFIRGMWATHSRTLATRLGKPLPESALKITGPQPLPEHQAERTGEPNMVRTDDQHKITVTANVELPQSGYTYRALEPAIIDTPQLRDMGEATPPLEWIGLHRDKLPNVTHQVVVVSLLEVAKEVEDAYGRILGSA